MNFHFFKFQGTSCQFQVSGFKVHSTPLARGRGGGGEAFFTFNSYTLAKPLHGCLPASWQ